jgi:hypothetical protein
MRTWLVRAVRSITASAVCGFLLAPRIAVAQASEDASQTQAQAPAPALKVAVLRATQGDAGDLANAIDGALLRDLGALAGIENPTVAPIDYAEIQLTVGCSDEGRQCLAAIAQMVQVDAVVVRHLVVEPNKATLTLVHFDATSSDEPAHAEQIVEGNEPTQALVDGVPSLVRKLFGIPEPVTAAAAPSSRTSGQPADYEANPNGNQADSHGPSIGPLTWVALGVGTAVLAGGLVVGAMAQSDDDAFKKTEINSDQDIERANAKFDSAEKKGQIATILIPAGAVVLALGATLLVLDLTSDESAPQMALTPLPGGGMLSLRARGEGL